MITQVLLLLVGLQFGDEGKGKITDDLIRATQTLNDGKKVITVRFQGGANAGHTIFHKKSDGTMAKFICHLTPSGIARNTDIAIGPNVAFNPIQFVQEVDKARKDLQFSGNILISERVGILFDYHKKIDAYRETNSQTSLGTTKSGIGPFYEDNARRTTRITFADYISSQFPQKLKQVLEAKKSELSALGFSVNGYCDELLAIHEPIRKQLAPYRERLEYRLQEYLDNGDHIIIEGAQGSMLDVDMGSLPHITSSHLLAPHAFASLGLPRKKFKIIGIEKTYPTRIGNGILPSLTDDSFAENVAQVGQEFGATTGRARRIGYPDWVLIKRSVMLNDCDGIILTRLDTVQDLPIKVVSEYVVDNKKTNEMPLDLELIEKLSYMDNIFNWQLKKNINSELVGFDNLPTSLKEYINLHDSYTGCPIIALSVGPYPGDIVYKFNEQPIKQLLNA